MSNSILFIQMGGSIDKKLPFKLDNYDFAIDEAAFDIVLPRVLPGFSYRTEYLCKKDSMDINEEDIATLQQAISESPENKIVVTVGTDRAAAIASKINYGQKTIIFTGAYAPVFMKETDADFNIGFAVAGAQTLTPGVYLAMNGRFLNPKKTVKDPTTLLFIEK